MLLIGIGVIYLRKLRILNTSDMLVAQRFFCSQRLAGLVFTMKMITSLQLYQCDMHSHAGRTATHNPSKS